MKGKKTGGRKAGIPNKVTADVRTAAQEHGRAAVDALSAIMRDVAAPAAARVSAANALLDRGYGKVPPSDAAPGGEDVKRIIVFGGIQG
jgi:hypothetical protein